MNDIGGSAERFGCYTVVAGAPQQTAYHEFRMRYPWKKPFGVSVYALDVPATVLAHLPIAPLLSWMYPVD